jgi:uncharacterized protein
MKLHWLFILVLVLPVVHARSGHITGLSVISENESLGATADIFLEIRPGRGAVYIESFPLTKIDTQISTRLAKEAACQRTTVNCNQYDFFYIINVPSSVIGGPSAGGAISVLTYAVLEDLPIDDSIAMTGTIMSGGIIGPVGGVPGKVSGAATAGIDTVLIPAWETNTTGIPLEDKYNITVHRIRTLDEAIFYFTGEQQDHNTSIVPPKGYTEGMQKVSEQLCEHAQQLLEVAPATNVTNMSSMQYARSQNASEQRAYYSAASLCFSSAMQTQTVVFENMSRKERRALLRDIIADRAAFESAAHEYEVQTIADLEILLIVTERIDDVSKAVSEINTTSPDAATLAYAYERLETARAWYSMLGTIDSTKAEITPARLELSCQQKLEEAQERINYLAYIYPAYTSSLEQSLHDAFRSADAQQYSLCLLQASQAKAEANALMTALYAPPEELNSVISEKLSASANQLHRQTESGTFPILGYSYHEYSTALSAEEDSYSSLLYAEYSLELGALDIYFPEKKQTIIVDMRILFIFSIGVLLGLGIGIGISTIIRAEKPRPKKATIARNLPGKKR